MMENWNLNFSKLDAFGHAQELEYIYTSDISPYKEFISKEFKSKIPLREKVIYSLTLKIKENSITWLLEVLEGELNLEEIKEKELKKGELIFKIGSDLNAIIALIMRKSEPLIISDWKKR